MSSFVIVVVVVLIVFLISILLSMSVQLARIELLLKIIALKSCHDSTDEVKQSIKRVRQ